MGRLNSVGRASALASAWVVFGVGASPYRFDIAAGPAADRLLRFCNQADLSLVADYHVVNRHETRAIAGTWEPRNAMRLMLEGTGLGFRFLEPRSVVVFEVEATPVTVPAKASKPPKSSRHLADDNVVGDAEVRIFGEREHGRLQLDTGGALLTLDSDATENAGLSDPYDLVRTLPQVSGAGPTEQTLAFGTEARTNWSRGSGINLRGLDASATVVLVDGKPLAPAGSAGVFIDVANLPWNAIARTEIATDAGSIQYGASAIGGITNFILRRAVGMEIDATEESHDSGSPRRRVMASSYGRHWDGGGVSLSYQYLRRSALIGAEREQGTSDLRTLGGCNFDDPGGNPGTVLAGGVEWAIPAGKHGPILRPSDFTPGTANYTDLFRSSSILPEQKLNSAVLQVWQQAGARWSVYLDALGSWRHAMETWVPETALLRVPATSPYFVNPAADGADSVSVLYGFGPLLHSVQVHSAVDSGRVLAGAKFSNVGFWTGEIYAGQAWSTERQVQNNRVNYIRLEQDLDGQNGAAARFDPFADPPTLDPKVLAEIRSEARGGLRSQVRFLNLTAGRPISVGFGTAVDLQVGADLRHEGFRSSILNPGESPLTTHELDRSVKALFGEVTFQEANSPDAPGRWKLAAGLRYEHYDRVGGAAAPRLGLTFSPYGGVRLRSSLARLFRAPTLAQLSESTNIIGITNVLDPKVPGRLDPVLIWTGNNADLRPERATTWTAGLDITSSSHPRTSVAVTFFQTLFSSRIADAPYLGPGALSDPSLRWLVEPSVTAARRNDVCGRGAFLGILKYCTEAPVAALIDLRTQNIATLETRGFDLQTTYGLDVGHSRMSFGLLGTYLLQYSESQLPTDPLYSRLNTPHYPINFRLNGTLTWCSGGLGVGSVVHFQNGYRDTTSVPTRSVRSWTTQDLVISLTWPDSEAGEFGSRPGQQVQTSLRISNVLNASPPFLNNFLEHIGYDEENGNLLGRMVSLTVRERW